jgi:hypothetical protein
MANNQNKSLALQLGLQMLPTLIQQAEDIFGPGTGVQKHAAVVSAAALVASGGMVVVGNNNPSYISMLNYFGTIISAIVNHRNAVGDPVVPSSGLGLASGPMTPTASPVFSATVSSL